MVVAIGTKLSVSVGCFVSSLASLSEYFLGLDLFSVEAVEVVEVDVVSFLSFFSRSRCFSFRF
jgi:hypothetical protein